MELFWKVSCLISAAAFTSATTVDIGCDQGWLKAFGSCFYFNNKKLVTWSEASNECDGYDASPMFFTTPEELDWYINVVKSQYPSSGYWTSMNDIANNDQNAPGTGFWTWGLYMAIDTSIVSWSSSPAYNGRPVCGGINMQGKMYDADCNSRQGYMCMIDGAVSQGPGCPLGWLVTDTDCYYLSNTSDPGQLMTWSQAKTWCTTLNPGAHLFVLDDVNDQNFLIGDLPYVSQSSYLFWTGLQGNGQPGGWTWVNGAPFNQQLFSWAVEPDDVAGTENCAVIRYNGKFSDRSCNIQQNYICRKPELIMDSTWNMGCGLWIRAGSKCYRFYANPVSTWTDAKQACFSLQGDLVNVNDLDTKEWLFEQMLEPDAWHAYWTALNDRDTEGVYKWGDGSVLDPTTINWNQEPNNYQGDEDCGVMWVTGEFNDIKCGYHAAPLCELDNVQTCPGSAMGTWVSRPSDSGVGVNCYYFGSYANRSVLRTQPEAAVFCTSLALRSVDQYGTPIDVVPQLYAVNTQAERDFMKQQLQNFQDNDFGFWTSLNDKIAEGFWQFGNDPTIDTSFIDWRGEPNSATDDTDCVFMSYGAHMSVVKCSRKYGFICERPVNLQNSANSSRLLGVAAILAKMMISCCLRLLQ